MISSFLRKQFIRLSIPLSWRRSRDHVALSLEQFSRVEADSAWQMLKVAELVKDDKLRCELFENALEEMHHAALFKEASTHFKTHARSAVSYTRSQLYHSGDDLGQFLAYQHMGEKEIHQQFDAYARASTYPEVSAIFARIEEDEGDHQREAHSRLSNYFGTSKKTRTYIFKATLRRELEILARLGEVIGGVMSALVLFPVYVVSGLTVGVLCRKKMQNTRWYSDNPETASWKVLE